MNQTKVLEIKKYLLRHLENHLNNKQSAINVSLREQFAPSLRTLKKLDAATRKAYETFREAKEKAIKEIRKVDSRANFQGGISNSYSTMELDIYLSDNKRTFATINSREYYQCPESMMQVARQAAADIDHFCLTVMLDGDITDVEAFKTNLLRNI